MQSLTLLIVIIIINNYDLAPHGERVHMDHKQERMTKQRKVILEELRKAKSHPTAYDVHEMVRGKLPQISLGTVYRNLEYLSSKGLIQKLDMGKGQRRFDATTEEHAHIMCVTCGKVEDIALQPDLNILTMKDIVKEQIGFEIIGYAMELHGICPACRAVTGTH
jgi:Fur family transcriptional regulator, ferric uptake regulator